MANTGRGQIIVALIICCQVHKIYYLWLQIFFIESLDANDHKFIGKFVIIVKYKFFGAMTMWLLKVYKTRCITGAKKSNMGM